MAVGTRANENANPNVNVTVVGAGLDRLIPTIPEPHDEYIIVKFKYPTLALIKGKPTFDNMKEATRQLRRNALAVKLLFRGDKIACLGEVLGI